jgi:hypothetical protein
MAGCRFSVVPSSNESASAHAVRQGFEFGQGTRTDEAYSAACVRSLPALLLRPLHGRHAPYALPLAPPMQALTSVHSVLP